MTDTDNNSQAPGTIKTSSADKLELIREQRAALTEIVKISLAISRLQEGLQSVLLLGKDSSSIPRSYLLQYDALKESIYHEPTSKLEASVTVLDKQINNSIKHVIKIVDDAERNLFEADSSTNALDSIHSHIHEELDEFRRKSQTAVVVRLLLRERNVQTEALVLAVPEEEIVAKLAELDSKEKRCRKRIQVEIVSMDKQITTMLETPGLPEETQAELQSIKDNLLKNLAHLISGKSLENLPVVFEIIEMGSEEDHQYAFKPTSLPREDPVDTTPPPASAKETKKTKRSFISRAIEWCTTPPRVGWKDIDKYK